MYTNIILAISFIGVALHLCLEAKYFAAWKEGKAMFPKTGYFEKTALIISCASIMIIYGLIVFLEIYVRNDFSKILIVGAQGAIFFNFLVHFLLKYIWKRNMPCFWSSFFFGFLSCIAISQMSFTTSWFSVSLFLEIFLFGMVVEAILALSSLKAASLLASAHVDIIDNSWEKF